MQPGFKANIFCGVSFVKPRKKTGFFYKISLFWFKALKTC